MAELKKRATETEEKPKWLITDEDGVVTVPLCCNLIDKRPK